MMKRLKWIVIGLCCVGNIIAAQTEEQKQQFLYYYYEAERLIINGEYGQAFRLMDFCYGLNPDDPNVNIFLGKCYLQVFKNPQQALFHFRKAEGDKKHPSDNPEVWEGEIIIYSQLGLYQKALQAQDELDRIDGYDAYSALNRFRIYSVSGDKKGALKELNRYIAIDSTNMDFLLYRVLLYEELGAQPSTLINAYEQILRLDPYNALVLNNYAYYIAEQSPQKAEKMSERAIQIEPENPVYLDTYAWILWQLGEQTMAGYYMRKTLELYQGKKIPKEIQKHAKQILNDE